MKPVVLLSISINCVAIGSFIEYRGVDTYNFFDKFDFYNGEDPTKGFVEYAPNGRKSIRLESKTTYTHGLFIFDLEHMPSGCATWPSTWFLGSDPWPLNGEFDILEGVNLGKSNRVSIHTQKTCIVPMDNTRMTSEYFYSPADNVNINNTLICGKDDKRKWGCQVDDPNTLSYGEAFNKNKGGVYVFLWEPTGAKVWFFTRNSIPSNIETPNPASWGLPVLDFPFGPTCEQSNFKNHRIVINLTFCGSWAGAPPVYEGDGCPGKCEDLARDSPESFKEAYWNYRSLKVYQKVQYHLLFIIAFKR
ncbi:concanavalin A-like lectin/glucanase domain-containing protein [Globomyces pollinis-pini]|nr:concanavalin A-like lectin/glucanase domain-containing protein [Globomyces pollinis-pini]